MRCWAYATKAWDFGGEARIGEAKRPGPDKATGAQIIAAFVTGKAGIYKLIETTEADALLIQKHKLLAHQLANIREQIWRLGWRPI